MDCKQASQVISQSLDRKLSLRERVALYLHLRICEACRNYSQHLQTLRVAIKRMTSSIEDNDTIEIPAEAKKRITELVETHHQQP